MLQDVILRLLSFVPPSLRSVFIGRPDNPGHFATLAHNFFNRFAPSKSRAFACRGTLEGYQMFIDWNRYRSFVYGTWEPEVSKVVTEIVKKGMTVIDIGAHHGYYSLYFAKCVGPTGRVFSFEPVPENFALLRKNILLNNISWIETFPDALFSCTKDISFAAPDESLASGDGSLVEGRGGRQILVHAVTLDSFCTPAQIRPDVIKMDVEGAELDVLLGAREIITRYSPKLLIELHHFDGNVAAHPVPRLLESRDYEVRWIERCQWTSHILAIPKTASPVA